MTSRFGHERRGKMDLVKFGVVLQNVKACAGKEGRAQLEDVKKRKRMDETLDLYVEGVTWM